MGWLFLSSLILHIQQQDKNLVHFPNLETNNLDQVSQPVVF